MTTEAAFMAAVRGIPTHHVTKALSSMTPGINWTRCSKKSMADAYATSNDSAKPRWLGHYQLRNLDLERLARRAKARAERDPDWRTK